MGRGQGVPIRAEVPHGPFADTNQQTADVDVVLYESAGDHWAKRGVPATERQIGFQVGIEPGATCLGRLERISRARDMMTRFGGDEFILLIRSATEEDVTTPAAGITKRMRLALADPFLVGNTTISLSASVGVAIGNCQDDDPDDVLRAADNAMYLDKRR